MNNLQMLEMALNALKQCTSNEWVDNHMGGVAVDWTFHTTDDDCEFEDE